MTQPPSRPSPKPPPWLLAVSAWANARLPAWLERVDTAPPWAATAGGAAVGAVAGASCLALPWPAAAGIAVVAAGAGAALAVSGYERVVAIPVPPPPPPGEHSVDRLLRMVDIPAGSFDMGSPGSDDMAYPHEKPQHRVAVSAFKLGAVPVTGRMWREVGGQGDVLIEGDDHPVTGVSWWQAVQFCNLLSDKARLRRAYVVTDTAVQWDPTADGFRLPTEAEREYACRGGRTTRYWFGDDPKALSAHAWWHENSGGNLQPAGHESKPPNPFGLFDMHGNVLEWCWDWYGRYAGGPAENPSGPDNGSVRVLRGGAFRFVSPVDLRAAYRLRNVPGLRDGLIGFRCARGPGRQP